MVSVFFALNGINDFGIQIHRCQGAHASDDAYGPHVSCPVFLNLELLVYHNALFLQSIPFSI